MKNRSKEKIMPIPLMAEKTKWWLIAINTQISRIEDNIESERYVDNIQRNIDDNFLKISLYQLYKWLNEFNKYVNEFENILNRMKSLGDFKLIRDTAEHEIEYYRNIGNKQNIFINKKYNQSINRPLIINNEYYISGIINVNNIKQIADELELVLKSNKYSFKYEALSKLNELTRVTIV